MFKVAFYCVNSNKFLETEGQSFVADYATCGGLTIKCDFKRFKILVITANKIIPVVLRQNTAIN